MWTSPNEIAPLCDTAILNLSLIHILAKNYEAKAYGVQTGDPMWMAKKKCPDIVFVPPHYDLYMKHSKLIREIYSEYTDQVEPYLSLIHIYWQFRLHFLKQYNFPMRHSYTRQQSFLLRQAQL